MKSELWFFWIHFNIFIYHISLLIQYHEFRTLNSHLLSVMNAYYEFIIHIMSSLWIHYNEIKFMNSDWIPWTLISEFLVHIFMNPYINWESIHLNSYTWIHILMSHEFRIRTFEFIYMNSYTHEFIYSFHLRIQMYMNS